MTRRDLDSILKSAGKACGILAVAVACGKTNRELLEQAERLLRAATDALSNALSARQGDY